METLQDYNWTITIMMCVLGILVLVTGAYFIVWYGKEQTRLYNEYMRYYEKIQRVMTYEVCEANYQWIMRLLNDLGQCKYKDKERTEVLTMNFFKQYQEVLKTRISEND